MEHNTVIVPVSEVPQKMAVVWTMVGTVVGDGLQTQSQPDAGGRDRGFQREVNHKDPLVLVLPTLYPAEQKSRHLGAGWLKVSAS